MLAFLISNVCLAQKIEGSQIENGVVRISTKSEEFGFKENTSYHLEVFSDGEQKDYMLMVSTEKNEAHSFPDNAKLLLKLMDNSVLSLQAVFSMAGELEEEKVEAFAFYHITEEQLNSLSGGISKVRVEMLSVDKNDNPYVENQEKDFKKDKIGKTILAMKELLDKELAKIVQQQAANKKALQRNESSDF